MLSPTVKYFDTVTRLWHSVNKQLCKLGMRTPWTLEHANDEKVDTSAMKDDMLCVDGVLSRASIMVT